MHELIEGRSISIRGKSGVYARWTKALTLKGAISVGHKFYTSIRKNDDHMLRNQSGQ